MSEHRSDSPPESTADLRAFFSVRAAGWEQRYPDDGPSYAAAVDVLAPQLEDRVLDAGCGTGRALPELRRTVGPSGSVIGVDLTPEMLDEARHLGRDGEVATLIRADVMRLPLRDKLISGIFAAGLLTHLPNAVAGLAELARVSTPTARLVLFHPVGRAELARRRGHDLSPADPRSPENLPDVLRGGGWELLELEDEPDRYLAVARRSGGDRVAQ